jgi:tRNA threonylcarbamoyladenosine biosynthesis protein TsaB
MKLLALETSGSAGTVALAIDEDIREQTIRSAREQTASVLPAVDALLADAGITLADLDAITFGRGPGSFTGLRVSAAIAQGLAAATGLRLLPVSSLAALAQRLWREHHAERALLCVDARMGDVYWGEYELRDGLAIAVGDERISPPQDVLAPAGAAWVAAGSGLATYRDALAHVTQSAVAVFDDLEPLARDLVPLARHDLAAGRTVAPEQALPVYLRGQDAWKRPSRNGP